MEGTADHAQHLHTTTQRDTTSMTWKLVSIGMAFIAIVVSVACATLASQYEARMSKVERANAALRKTNAQQTEALSGLVQIQGLQSGLMKSMVRNHQLIVKVINQDRRELSTFATNP